MFGPVTMVAIARGLSAFKDESKSETVAENDPAKPRKRKRFDKDYWRDVIGSFIAGMTLVNMQLRFLDDTKRDLEQKENAKKFAAMAAAEQPLDFVYECDSPSGRLVITVNRTDNSSTGISEYWLELAPAIEDANGGEPTIIIKGKPAGEPKSLQMTDLRPNSKSDPIEILPLLEREYGGGFVAFLNNCEGCRIHSFRAKMTYVLWNQEKKYHRRPLITCKS